MASNDVGDAVTMKNIAQRAGVSVTTVSRMLTMPEKVALPTQQRIQKAMGELGCNAYDLNRQAKTGPANILLLILSNVSDPRFSQIIRGIEQQSAQAGYLLLMLEHPQETATQWMIEFILSGKVVGILIMDSNLFVQLANKASQPPPMVVIGESANHLSLPSVSMDHLMAAFEAVEYLYQLGHRRIACIAGPQDQTVTHYRLQGYQQVLRRHHLAINDKYCYYADLDYLSGCQGLQQLMMLPSPPTAIVCHSELIALGALSQAKKMQLQVPRDLSLLSFDGLEISRHCDPPLTIVRQPGYEMGRQAVVMLLALVKSQPIDQMGRLVKSELVIGGSTAWLC